MNFKLNTIIPVLFILVAGSFVVFSFRPSQSNQDVTDNNIKTNEAVDATIGVKKKATELIPIVTITSATCKVDSTIKTAGGYIHKQISLTANGTMKGSPGDYSDIGVSGLGFNLPPTSMPVTAVSVDCGSWSRTKNERTEVAACIREEGQPESSVWSLKWINLSSSEITIKGELRASIWPSPEAIQNLICN